MKGLRLASLAYNPKHFYNKKMSNQDGNYAKGQVLERAKVPREASEGNIVSKKRLSPDQGSEDNGAADAIENEQAPASKKPRMQSSAQHTSPFSAPLYSKNFAQEEAGTLMGPLLEPKSRMTGFDGEEPSAGTDIMLSS